MLAAFALCLVKGINQRLVEFPQSRQLLLEGERTGWTNIPPAMFAEMKHNRVVITTNGVDVANPAILAKFAKGRVNGTLVYPNALAGLILLLLPASLVLAFTRTKRLRPPIRAAVIALTVFLGVAAFFWTGSKLGWLIAMAIGGVCPFRLPWPMTLKFATLTGILLVGLVIFAVRFHSYFAGGATSVGARFDYWRAAVKTTLGIRCSERGRALFNGHTNGSNHRQLKWPAWHTTTISNSFPIPASRAEFFTRLGLPCRWQPLAGRWGIGATR